MSHAENVQRGGEGEHSDGFLDDSVSSHAQQNSVIQFKFENLSFSITKKKKKKKKGLYMK